MHLSLTSALDGGGWSTPRNGRFNPGKETRYPLHRRLGGPQGRFGRVRKMEFDPRTVQPVASHYTDCAIPGHIPGQSMRNLWWTKWHWDRFPTEYFDLPLSMPFHKCSTLIFTYMLFLPGPRGAG